MLFAANAAFVEALIAQHLGYASALALVASIVLAGDAIVIALGNERKGADLHATVPAVTLRHGSPQGHAT